MIFQCTGCVGGAVTEKERGSDKLKFIVQINLIFFTTKRSVDTCTCATLDVHPPTLILYSPNPAALLLASEAMGCVPYPLFDS